MLSRQRLLLIISTLAIVAIGVLWMTGVPNRNGKPMPLYNVIDSPSGAVIKGYDPVAYFVDGRPRKGSEDFTVEYGGARWLFASAANKAKFKAEPDKYVPAYGGYCAYGVAQGYLVKIEPDAWSIKNGKLFLNYDSSVQEEWQKDWQAFVDSANAKWPRLQGKS